MAEFKAALSYKELQKKAELKEETQGEGLLERGSVEKY